MNDLRTAAQQALEALEAYLSDELRPYEAAKTADALRAALAEPVQEPVAWMYTGVKQDGIEHGPHLVWKPEYMDAMSASKGAKATPLYTAPPPAEPVQEPDYWQEEARRYAGNADYWRKRYEALAEPGQEPAKFWPLAPLTGYYDVGGNRVWLEKDDPFPQPSPPQRPPLTEEEIDKAVAQERDALLDHIYEYGTLAEGVLERIRKLCRAIERKVRGE